MVLSYPGGICLPTRADALKNDLTLANVPKVFLPLGGEEETYTLAVCEGENVLAGAKVAVLGDETPIYASIPGKVTGVFEKDGMHYVGIERDPALKTDIRTVREPESKRLAEMTPEELSDAVRVLGIHDVWSGDWLWRRTARAMGETRRVVIDTTDDSGWSFTGYRTALKYPGEVLGGAKVLLHLLGATKIILLTDSARKKTFESFQALINDPALIILAEAETKYPMREETMYEAIYARHLKRGQSAEDEGVFFLRAQTAVQLYRSVLTGKPQTTRVLTAAGDGFGRNAVLTVPLGTPWKTALDAAQFKGGAYETRVGSLLCDKRAEGAMDGRAEAVFASLADRKAEAHCISCGRCASVCPMRLQPYEILTSKSYRTVRHLTSVCIGCGCCEYICPSAIRLREHMRKTCR